MAAKDQTGWENLCRYTESLEFEAHDIRGQLDSTGHYSPPFPRDFPLSIRLFHYRHSKFTRGTTWHEQLELFVTLKGTVTIQMGEELVGLDAGDLLVVDNLKLHQVVDAPGLDAKVIVVSFMPELAYTLGAPTHDFAFLLPFQSQLPGRPNILEHSDAAARAIHQALADLLSEYFPKKAVPYREAACRARLISLLLPLARRFHDAGIQRWEFERKQMAADRFKKLIERIHEEIAEKLPLKEAARMCGMSTAQFTRNFKSAAGMTYVAYVTHVRLAEAARLLRSTTQSIAEIAARTGFTDQSYFDRRFKINHGLTPREFQQRNRG